MSPMTSVILQRTASARPNQSPSRAGAVEVRALLRAQTGYYERHVLAWYALGRVREARAAWAAVSTLRRCLADAEIVATCSTPAFDAHLRRS